MVSRTLIEPVAKGFLLMTNILSTVRIDKLVVPEVIASDSSSASLECVYSGTGDDVSVLWLLNGTQVYEWREGTEPRASGLLEGRIDLSHKTSFLHQVQQRTLRLVELSPDLSGDYSCVVQSRGQEARQTKTMMVFSPEHEFELTITKVKPDVLNVRCIAKHLYPQPDLIIECNKIAIPQQQQRTWRQGSFYDSECTAVMSSEHFVENSEVACRLQIPQVDYTVITKKTVSMGNTNSGTSPLFPRLASLQTIIAIGVLTSRLSGVQTQ